ncbi:MAG: treZ [Gemmatimonadetes bacterium]|nr:treZ [Gemmatimonadota bacterium]
MTDHRPQLRRLASRLGIEDEFVDQLGGMRRTTDETREILLAAMGHDASTEAAAADALRALKRDRRRHVIAPVHVVRQRSRSLKRVRVRIPHMHAGAVQWTITLRTEEGIISRWSGTIEGGEPRRHTFDLPATLPLGYHDLVVRFQGGGKRRTGAQRLIVVPSQCTQPEARLAGRRGFGITTNLYTIRSASNWGAGDIGDITSIARWLGQHGGAFVGMNPMHALRNEGYDVSPYSPITRLFRNPLYLRIDDIPELQHDTAARARIASQEFQDAVTDLRAATMLENARVMALRAPILESLHRTFVEREVRPRTIRGRAYAEYAKREDPALTLFATYMTIAEREGPDAREWPAPFRDPHGESVAAFRREHAGRIDYHCWLQFELDRQLGVAAADAAEAGLALGMYQDLAVGSSASGSDVWSYPELFRQGATVGAPPDMYSDDGQNWGLPAIDPHVLRQTGYDYWIRILRAGFRHTGALRIDHALGLFRMYWVPLGESARQGAYVRSFTNELLGILALESVRHNALVVGEDLGTIPPHVPAVLAKWGVLGSRVQVFERDFHSGRFRPASEYPRMALATVNTHDLPPLVGWAEGRDVALRTEVGDLSDPAVASQMFDARRRDVDALVASLVEAGLLPQDAHNGVASDALIMAVHAFIRRTPSALVGLSFDDLALESAPVNIPGVWQDKYPSWSRRMRATLETLLADSRTVRLLGA